MRRVAPALALFLTAPLVAEFLLGNMSITALPLLIVIAPMYGGGALLIRECIRRTGRGWPSLLLLASAYGVIEEGLATQSLFNRDYLRLGLHLLDPGYVPALGMGAWWTVYVLTLHVVWSISVPIVLVEALVPGRARAPWLGRPGLGLTGVLFAAGAAATMAFTLEADPFVASVPQLAGAVLGALVLVVLAFAWPRRKESRTPYVSADDAPPAGGAVPSPWMIGAAGLIAGSAFLIVPPHWGWWAAAACFSICAAAAIAVAGWARGSAWSLRHELALAAGAASAYAWHAFAQTPTIGGGGPVTRAGNVLFACGLLVVVVLGSKRSRAVSAETGRVAAR